VAGEQFQYRLRGVGLHRIADQVIAMREGLLKELEMLDNALGGVDVERRAVALGKRLQRDAAAVQRRARLRVIKGTRR